MSAVAVDAVCNATRHLIAILGGSDVSEIERANDALALAVADLRQDSDIVPSAAALGDLEKALDLTELARVGTALLQDAATRRAEALALMRGGHSRAIAYHRDGRTRVSF